MVKGTGWGRGLEVTAGGRGLVPLAGASAVRLLAERTGLNRALSAVVPAPDLVVHARGRVLTDLAVAVLAGGEAISDIDTLAGQNALAGPVASTATSWRTLDAVAGPVLFRVARARARVRAGVWARVRVPASPVAGRDLGATIVLDVDATLVGAHSEKEHAAPTYKRGFGYHPLGVWCDNTAELLALKLRAGNAGANNAADHIEVLTEAMAQVPWPRRRDLLIRADSAGASHALLDWMTCRDATHLYRVQYSIGFALSQPLREAVTALPSTAWTPAIEADGTARDGADVAEITGLLPAAFRNRWPDRMRWIVRRERPHPGAQLSVFEDNDGWRYQAFVTNTAAGQLAFLEARHRAHARVEDHIKQAKDTGLGRFPSRHFTLNQAWCLVVALAADLKAWLQLIALDGPQARCAIKALRHQILTVPADLTRHARRHQLAFPEHWPWVAQITRAFTRIQAYTPG